MTDPAGAGIYTNIKGVYWWDPWHTIYSSTMDPMGTIIIYSSALDMLSDIYSDIIYILFQFFSLAWHLAFYLAFYLTSSDILSGISSILSVIRFGTLSGIYSILTFYLSTLLAFLAFWQYLTVLPSGNLTELRKITIFNSYIYIYVKNHRRAAGKCAIRRGPAWVSVLFLNHPKSIEIRAEL